MPYSDYDLANFRWYSGESSRLGLTPRCPFASADRCPKYFETLVLLHGAGVTTGPSRDDGDRLEQKWKQHRHMVAEEAVSTTLVGGDFHGIHRMCPEIGFDIFGHFSKSFSKHADSIDSAFAHQLLSASGAPKDHPAWAWSGIEPQHYAECRTYALLTRAPSESDSGTYRPGWLVAFLKNEARKRGVLYTVLVTVAGIVLAILAL